MKTSIRLKLLAYTFLIVLIVGGSISLFFIREGRNEILSSYEKKSRQLTDLVSQIIINDVYFLDTHAIRMHLQDARINPDVIETYVMDGEGKILSDGTPQNIWSDRKLQDPFSQKILKAKSWISSFEDKVLKVGGPIHLPDGSVVGYLQMGFSLERSHQIIQHTTQMNILITFFCLAIGAFLAFVISATFTKPIYKLLEATQEIKKGNFKVRVLDRKNDELGALADSFNQMVEELEKNTSSITQLNESLKRSNKELEQFSYIASHDLQEPLYIIASFVDSIREKYGVNLDKNILHLLDRIQKASERMGFLIKDLLEFARVNTRARPFEEVELNPLIQEVISELEIRIQESGAEIQVEKLPRVYADKIQMQQLFQNLISNAIKFRKKDLPPRIAIQALSSAEGFVQVSVKDNGIGFEKEYTDKILEPFQRLHSRSEYEGSGLGLAICRKIVSRHKGHIMAQSVPDQGSTFVVTLPIHHLP